MNVDIKDKILGCLYGQAIGDALGLGSEFMNREEIAIHYPHGLRKYEDIIQDAHRSRWPIGAWTDDTDMMLCILKAYKNGSINSRDVAINFKDWFNGTPMGIGNHTYKVLCMGDYVDNAELCSKLWWELSRKTSAANGALMRTSVIGLLQDNYIDTAEKVCKLTHFDPRCIGSCVILTILIHELVWLNKLLSKDEIIEIGNKYDDRIKDYVDLAFNSKSIEELNLDERHSIGYTLKTLSAGLWCYFHSNNFEAGLLTIVNQGGDADTNGAVAGSILGAKFGELAIPEYYKKKLHNSEIYKNIITEFTSQLIKASVSF